MKGVHITVYYGYKYYDEEYDVEKTGWDWVYIGKEDEPVSRMSSLVEKFKEAWG